MILRDARRGQRPRDDGALTDKVYGLTVGGVLDRFVKAKELAGKAPATIEQYRWASGIAKGAVGGDGGSRAHP